MAALVDIDPRRIIPNPHNPRVDIPQLQDLIDSIKAVGVLQPVIVFPVDPPPDRLSDDTEIALAASPDHQLYMLLIGHRRHAAVLQLGLPTIPCVIAESEAVAQQLVKILAEAGQGVDLSVLEEANAFHQLELLDWSPEQIASATARPVAKVRTALSLHHLPAQARTVAARAADAGDLDLEQIAALQQFAGDPKVMNRIATRAQSGPWGVQHVIAEEQKKLERRQQQDRLRAELTLAGVRIVSRPQGWPYQSREAEASTLTDAEGQPLDPEHVKARPGFAAFIDTQNMAGDPRAVIICVDPEAWGYTRTVRTSYVPDSRRTEVDEQARLAAQRKDALATAAKVRRTFLSQTYGTARAAKKVYLDALRDAVREPQTIRVTSTDEDLAASLAGADFSTDAATAGIDRLTRMLVARWLTASETNVDNCVQHRWTADPVAALAYLDRLIAAGYVLSDAEQDVYTDLTAETMDDEDTDADSDDDVDLDETIIIEGTPADDPEPADNTPDDQTDDGQPSDHHQVDDAPDRNSGDEVSTTHVDQFAASA